MAFGGPSMQEGSRRSLRGRLQSAPPDGGGTPFGPFPQAPWPINRAMGGCKWK